ncbi:hypothetical protein Avbf_18030, partial [Armadillidium vulgare]
MSDAKRKPSGSEFKKRRLSKQTQPQKQSDALQNFSKEGSFNAPTTDQHLKNAQHLDTDFQDMDPPLDATVSITELDQAINALETRYNLLNTHSNYFSFLYNIFGLKDMPRNELLAHCKDLEVVLTDGNSSDLKALELADEISIVSHKKDREKDKENRALQEKRKEDERRRSRERRERDKREERE